MKKIFILLLSIASLFAVQFHATAADEKQKETNKNETKVDIISRDGYTLKFMCNDPEFPDELKKKMADTFFKVYPKMSADFNPKSPKSVTFDVKAKMDGIAHAGGGVITISAQWMKNQKGNDLDVITHEGMHIVQSYPGWSGPGWVTEGIADYARAKYGVDNKGSGWDMPNFSKNQKYTDAYRVTARFFLWLEKNVDKDLIKKMDDKMRTKKYTEDTWKELTGKTVDELWEMYGENPDKGM